MIASIIFGRQPVIIIDLPPENLVCDDPWASACRDRNTAAVPQKPPPGRSAAYFPCGFVGRSDPTERASERRLGQAAMCARPATDASPSGGALAIGRSRLPAGPAPRPRRLNDPRAWVGCVLGRSRIVSSSGDQGDVAVLLLLLCLAC